MSRVGKHIHRISLNVRRVFSEEKKAGAVFVDLEAALVSYGTMALPASFCICCKKGTWSK